MILRGKQTKTKKKLKNIFNGRNKKLSFELLTFQEFELELYPKKPRLALSK